MASTSFDDGAPRGTLKKHTLTRQIRFDCDRQLLLDVGRNDARWLADTRELEHSQSQPQSSQVLFDLGKAFEQRVYRILDHRNLYTQAARDPHGKIDTRRIDPAAWRAIAVDLLASQFDETFMLEHEFEAPHNLFKRWLGVDIEDELPILDPQLALRPDITIVSRAPTCLSRIALVGDGSVAELDPSDDRLEVRFVDIKRTNRESVGKKHYIELLYYVHAFALYLEEQGLDQIFYVPIDGHGILPQMKDGAAHVFSIEDFDELVEPMIWRDHAHLLTSLETKLSGLWSRAPVEIAAIKATLQPACTLCPYLGECRKLAGFDPDESVHPGASIDLLAYTSTSVAEQLKPHGIETVSDLDRANIPDPVTPTPLAAERPMLALKARALVSGLPVWRAPGTDGLSRHMSMAIPRFADAIVTFAAEQDPTNDRVFVYALALEILPDRDEDGETSSSRRAYAEVHDRLWSELDRQLDEHRPPTIESAVQRIYVDDELDTMVAADADITTDQLAERRVLRLARMVTILRRLDSDGDVSIDLTGAFQEHAWVRLSVGDLNNGKEDIDEQKMARQLVLHAVALVELVALYEELTCGIGSYTDDKSGEVGTYVQYPTSGLFYWSHDQIEHVRELLERHLVYMLTSSDIYDKFRQLMALVTPAESGIQHHYRSRKIFDLCAFVETTVGLPQVINYTWHETAHQMLPNSPSFDRRYWSAHCNYMYFGMWHTTLDGGSFGDRRALIDQARCKANVVAQLTRMFQKFARREQIVSTSSRAMTTREIASRQHDVPVNYHFIARAWSLYNRLDTTIQEQVAIDQRLTFPLKSIGKLVAAHVTNLEWRDTGRELRVEFTLEGLSSNAKFKPGSFVYFIHETRRDIAPDRWGTDSLVIESMEWDAMRSAYVVTGHIRKHSTTKKDKDRATLERFPDLDPSGWYLYDSTVDVWQSRLARAIAERNLATSWLGSRRAYLMGLMPADKALMVPDTYRFDVAEAVMYAPELMPTVELTDNFELMTLSNPPLDDSKQHALRQAFTTPMSCILGPPGTGKSQTIAALIDEYLCRHPEGPVKILVSASSYEPMSVVLDKLQTHCGVDGKPTHAAEIAKVWLRSSSREGLGRDDVYDFCLDGSSMLLDGVKISRSKKSKRFAGLNWRMDDELPERFVMFGVPFQLAQLLKTTKSGDGLFLHLDHFAFDLVVVDEASQMPVDQATTLLPLIRRATIETEPIHTVDLAAPLTDAALVEAMRLRELTNERGDVVSADSLTKIVFVGDHNQLPPVQQIEPPEKLRAVLESAFAYFQQHLRVPSTQLQTNYRSRPEVVAYTNSLELYQHPVIPFFANHPGIAPLPAPPMGSPLWLERVLADEQVVSALIHDSQFDTAVSEIEADIVTDIVCAFWWQMNPRTPEAEHIFWAEELGVVSPHNAHGRLIIRKIYARLTEDTPGSPTTHLDESDLMRALNDTIYSVEKFQGSARSFIIASMGLSAVDQIRAEETFIYDLNRLNVLTSRAVKKMLLVASRNLLDYVPRKRRMFGPAARLRDYAWRYCNVGDDFDYDGQTLTMRWHDTSLIDTVVSRPVDDPDASLEGCLESVMKDVEFGSRSSTKFDEPSRVLADRFDVISGDLCIKTLTKAKNYGNRISEATLKGPKAIVLVSDYFIDADVVLRNYESRALSRIPTLIADRSEGTWVIRGVIVESNAPATPFPEWVERFEVEACTSNASWTRDELVELVNHLLDFDGSKQIRLSDLPDHVPTEPTGLSQAKFVSSAKQVYNRVAEALGRPPGVLVLMANESLAEDLEKAVEKSLDASDSETIVLLALESDEELSIRVSEHSRENWNALGDDETRESTERLNDREENSAMNQDDASSYRRVSLVQEMVYNVPFDAHAPNLFEEKRSEENEPEPYETNAFRYVLSLISDPGVSMIVLTGDAGHGKTHLCRRLLQHRVGEGDSDRITSDEARALLIDDNEGRRAIEVVDGAKPIRVIKDLSEFEPLDAAVELLETHLKDESSISIVCANEGRLRSVVARAGGSLDLLLETLEAGLDSGRTSTGGAVHIVNLNYQSITPEGGGFLDHMLKQWTRDGRSWVNCNKCLAKDHCPILRNKETLGGKDEDSQRRRAGLEHLVRIAEQTGYVLTIREALILIAYLITGGTGCERVHEDHRNSDWNALEARRFERLLFERELNSHEAKQLRVLERIRHYDPGVVTHRDVDEDIVRRLEDGGGLGNDLWFGADDGAQYTRKKRRQDAMHLVELVRTARRESFFVDAPNDPSGITERSRRLGLYHYSDFDHIQSDDENPKMMRTIVERVVQGLHVVQGIRPSDTMSLHIVDPAFSRSGSTTSVIALSIPRNELWLYGLHEVWAESSGGEEAPMMRAVDWVDRAIVLCRGTREPESLVVMNLLQFEFVLRAANGVFFSHFHDSDRRRILTRLAKVAEESSGRRNGSVQAVVDDRIRTIVVERDNSIEVHGGH